MTPTLAQYAAFAQTFASRTATLLPLEIAGRDRGTSVQAVFRIGDAKNTKHYNETYFFSEELDMACIRLMYAAVAEVQDDTMMLEQEEYSRSLSEFHGINPYDGSEAEQEAELMDRRCGADREDARAESALNSPHYDWRSELHYDHRQYARGIR